jgi:hypothetical protein
VQFLKMSRIEWCEIMAGAKSTNPWVKSLVKMLKISCPAFIRQCPYVGRMELNGVTAIKEMVSIFPRGSFRMSSCLVDGDFKIMTYDCLFDVFD